MKAKKIMMLAVISSVLASAFLGGCGSSNDTKNDAEQNAENRCRRIL